jgi:hypothetical protein
MARSVLIVTRAQDEHADAVQAVLSRRHGVPVHRFDMQSFPADSKGVLRASAGKRASRLVLSSGPIDLQDIGAVWWRRPLGSRIPDVYFGVDRSFIQAEYDHFIEGLLWDIQAFWVNDPLCSRRAARKILQVRVAQESGLRLPETIISNDSDEIRAFARELGRQVVVKRVGTGPGPASKTMLLESGSLDAVVDEMWPTPAIFQEYIPPGIDLRTIWIDNKSWTARIESGKGSSPEDSRFDHSVPYGVHDLPEDVHAGLSRLMSKLGLRFGAVDFRVDDAGRTYFLEVNPAGQFLYLQARLGIPLIEAFADLLARGAAENGHAALPT